MVLEHVSWRHIFQQEEIRLLQDTSSEKRRYVSCKTDLARYERSHCAYKTMGCIRQESQPIGLYNGLALHCLIQWAGSLSYTVGQESQPIVLYKTMALARPICKTDGLATCVLAHMFQQEEIRLLQDTSSEKRRCVSCKTRDVSCKTDLPTHVPRRGDRVSCKTDLARYERSHCAYKTMGCIRQESQPIVLYNGLALHCLIQWDKRASPLSYTRQWAV